VRTTHSDKLTALARGALDEVTPEEMQLALLKLGGQLVDDVLDAHLQEGVELSPLHEVYYLEYLRILTDGGKTEARLRLLRALERNLTKTMREHHAWRHARQGNVVWEFSGPTGTGKSSCMLYLLETLNKVKPEDLEHHITIDVPELPAVLPKLKAGSGVAIDEQTHAVGEGSITQAKVLRSMEDQIRFSEIDIYWASPESQDHATSQGEFVAFAANRDKKYTRFVVYLNDEPLGYVNIPWCSPKMWAAYAPIKRRNVERALKASFQNTAIMDDVIKRLFENPGVQAACRVRRMKTPDWRRFIKRFAVSLNTSQVQSIAEEIEFMLDTILLRPDEFETIYGWRQTPAMVDAAGGIASQSNNTRRS
jgi:hypothetical protein